MAIMAVGQKSKTLEVDPVRSYSIKDEGKIDERVDGMSITIQADLSMPSTETPSFSAYEIRFPEAKLKGDTLTITILETNEMYHHMYTIEVANNRYTITYDFLNSGEEFDRSIKTKNFRLILNTNNFKKGQEIRGYTEYKGICTKGCWPSHSKFNIKGNFKVTIE
jgi:hypothetical protein